MKKSKVKWAKILVALIVCAGALALVAAGGQQSSGGNSNSAANVNAPGVFPIVKEKIDLKIGIPFNTTVTDFETNYYTLELEQKGNMDISFEIYAAPAIEKIRVELAGGGTLPEVLIGFGFSNIEVLNQGQDGVFLNLTEYYDRWGY